MGGVVTALGAIWRWLLRGRRHGAGGFAFYTGPRRITRWGIPKRVWSMLRRRQAVELTPISYLVVVGGGLVIGVVVQLTVGVWWWLPAAVLLVALWLLEGSSAFWGGAFGRHPYTLRTDLLTAISPQRGAAAHRAEDRAKLLGSGLPLFAPLDWQGPISLGGWSGRGRVLDSVSIVARDPGRPPSEGPALTLTTEAGEREEDSMRWHLFRPREAEPVWHPIVLRIDGREHDGWGVEDGADAFRYARVADHWLTVAGNAETVARPMHSIDPATVVGW